MHLHPTKWLGPNRTSVRARREGNLFIWSTASNATLNYQPCPAHPNSCYTSCRKLTGQTGRRPNRYCPCSIDSISRQQPIDPRTALLDCITEPPPRWLARSRFPSAGKSRPSSLTRKRRLGRTPMARSNRNRSPATPVCCSWSSQLSVSTHPCESQSRRLSWDSKLISSALRGRTSRRSSRQLATALPPRPKSGTSPSSSTRCSRCSPPSSVSSTLSRQRPRAPRSRPSFPRRPSCSPWPWSP